MIFLFFAELFFSEAIVALECIESYGEWSDQSMNMDKSRIHFSKNFCSSSIDSIYSILNLHKADAKAVYLGLPLFVGNRKRLIFHFVVDKVHKRIDG